MMQNDTVPSPSFVVQRRNVNGTVWEAFRPGLFPIMESGAFLVIKFVNTKPKVAKVLGFLIPFLFLDCNFLFATY